MFKKFLLCFAALTPVIAVAQTISLIGSTSSATGDFADYSSLASTDPWGDSSKTASGVTLTVSQTGIDSTVSKSTWGLTNYPGAGSEVNFIKGSGSTLPRGAVFDESFISFQLDTGTTLTTLDSISVSLWRNGSQAATDYQFTYTTDGIYANSTLGIAETTFDTTKIGSAVNITTTGSGNTFQVSSVVNSGQDTLHEVRLYYWGGAFAGNTHLYEVTANYTVVPEPSSFALLAGCFSLGVLALRRRR